MGTGTFFKLRNAISFSTKGISGKIYYFVKDKPTPVYDPQDIKHLRTKSELIECDMNGVPLTPTKTADKPLSFVKINPKDNFIPHNIGKVFTKDQSEETIKDAFKEPIYDYSNDPDVKRRLEQIQRGELTDAQKLALGLTDDKKEAATLTNESSKHTKKAKIAVSSKNGKFKCEKCGKKFTEEEDLKEHLKLHDEYDDD